ncbi:MAG: hypothetical protein HC848_09895 [Limnobacter sp.]|nr:hypothetical protein [Limnobacter sp.]
MGIGIATPLWAQETLPEVQVESEAIPAANPYGNAQAPYKAETLSSPKYSRPMPKRQKA